MIFGLFVYYSSSRVFGNVESTREVESNRWTLSVREFAEILPLEWLALQVYLVASNPLLNALKPISDAEDNVLILQKPFG